MIHFHLHLNIQAYLSRDRVISELLKYFINWKWFNCSYILFYGFLLTLLGLLQSGQEAQTKQQYWWMCHWGASKQNTLTTDRAWGKLSCTSEWTCLNSGRTKDTYAWQSDCNNCASNRIHAIFRYLDYKLNKQNYSSSLCASDIAVSTVKLLQCSCVFLMYCEMVIKMEKAEILNYTVVCLFDNVSRSVSLCNCWSAVHNMYRVSAVRMKTTSTVITGSLLAVMATWE